MSCHGSARLTINLLAGPISRDLFNYTSGRWLVNDALRHAERKLIFDVEGLIKLAAQSIGRQPDDVIDFSKLAEGGFNRIFLITFHDGFPNGRPYSYYAVASEVATMDFLRSYGLPIPQVHGYSPTSDNVAKTEYILMEFMKGTNLSDVWLEMGESDIVSVLRQIAQLESKMMTISFPAAGSLYYPHDLEKVTGSKGIPLRKNKCFCVGPDTRISMWHGRRSQLDVDRGPYQTTEEVLAGAAHKELAYLEQFSQPLLPFQRMRREGYGFQKQLPSNYIESLNRYLLIAQSLIPNNPATHHFCIRHPDLKQSNIIVSKSADTGWQVIGLIDWQHTSILPLFILGGIPDCLQNYDDEISLSSMPPPPLPENLSSLTESEQIEAKELHRRRLIHYQYVKNTAECNILHYEALTDRVGMFLRRLFYVASEPWEGETFALKDALIYATEKWERLTGGGAPCPVAFDAEDVRETKKLEAMLREDDKMFEAIRAIVNFDSDTWVSNMQYDEAMARGKCLKEKALAAAMSAEERAEIMAHWLLDDIDETNYL
ncbi:protein kinase subdomain-containing protein PKL/CAK/Fmp29 [Rhodocollybia butyracea]|uniref:Protein kinase subdomain-containing protein PKL/CAK/Fmp29 n=1 Tax=Rhodocollybia butyracea TaxID=206335 RepID=A0A9P5PAK4_9AGAR|nr:protein kinase subdomain-containing protein PKL/CAK/Fmp29 [Rhodocollybia butyracea]